MFQHFAVLTCMVRVVVINSNFYLKFEGAGVCQGERAPPNEALHMKNLMCF